MEDMLHDHVFPLFHSTLGYMRARVSRRRVFDNVAAMSHDLK